MPMLGASLEDLERLAHQLQTTTAEIGTVSGDTRRSVDDVVERLRQAGTTAVTTTRQQMEALRSTVGQAQSTADGADWVGRNADVFRSGYHDFTQAIVQAEEATTAYFDDLHTVLDKLGSDTEAYLTQLAGALERAQESTGSMAVAVAAQHDELDQVMNTGMRGG